MEKEEQRWQTEGLSFEKALDELEEITRKLESGNTSLEESMQLYERGIQLKQFCEKKLKDAEHRWMILRETASGDELQVIPSDKIPDINEFSAPIHSEK
ncbi:MAG: exodeoxyribonuclease VII small subunit [Leptospiraceae bacterium]|nr:exodeoxyribonuclease VII small subunit [Leptospiraceae bacterium]MDW8305843.1 exodeoxyribonuclease VII small subunit [Leptospiraceae bacterium]